MAEEMGKELGWEDEISNDGEEFVILPLGDYDFEVKKLERARFEGSEKMAPCNMAILSIEISGEAGKSTVRHNLLLNTKMEWKICEFYISIGLKKRGEPLKMAWGKVVGSKGKCKVGIRKWVNKFGVEMESNEITKFYEPSEPAQPTAPTGGWTPGKF